MKCYLVWWNGARENFIDSVVVEELVVGSGHLCSESESSSIIWSEATFLCRAGRRNSTRYSTFSERRRYDITSKVANMNKSIDIPDNALSQTGKENEDTLYVLSTVQNVQLCTQNY